ncbi:hydantoinase/oxoprolinase family protein [Roseococcus sp. SYP-B2431]|uniref:hydantoinase/oxoprolinase family protein n=1 Tax=Roseococcus sp. SYP-B2431 TaxID=2496640 RepID=UPI00103DDE76|nr:hydantoinase/oxoprolinase family protein [Roseococcus sp. SYP-B2431]TCH97545.1 hydantoinase/oxoprolinase family protein [Roseococcus sp. SYP-B2431]
MQHRLAVDIGGTFTDLVLEAPGRSFSHKLLTTPDAPERAVIEGTRILLASAGVQPSAIGLVLHGTTLATNALIERKGARTALITTEGFRDSIEIAYEHRFAQYDLTMERPVPLVPRALRYTVPERIAADGGVLLELDEAALRAVCGQARADGITAIAICFLHSFTNDAHERRAAAIVAEMLPGVSLSLSCEVCPEVREYDRASTTIANAYVRPLMDGYLAGIEGGLRGLGLNAPVLMMMSSGGLCTVEAARRFPVRLVESGPAGGAILARHVAAQNALDRVLAFDMGGTTAKLTLIDHGKFHMARSFEVARAYRFVQGSGLPIRIPVIELVEIGAGGGSIARHDSLGRIQIGPDSAGSKPGPASYGLGGTMPTVTDADLLLGRLDPDLFAGGTMKLDTAAADRAFTAMGAGAPVGVAEIVDETMASAARVHAVENGEDTAGRTMIAFGGAAPLHAARLAQKLGIAKVLVPRGAGVGSAHGFLQAPIGFEVVRTRYTRLDAMDGASLEAMFAEMRQEAEGVVLQAAAPEGLVETRTAFMRYRGQGHEIAVPVTGGIDPATLHDAFVAAYRGIFGRAIPGLQPEIMTWALSLSCPVAEPDLLAELPTEPARRPGRERPLTDPATGRTDPAAIHVRDALPPGAMLRGPALIIEDETTTVVPAGWSARINAAEQILLELLP